MLKADLHMHSCYSLDGEYAVAALLEMCKHAGLQIISVTDHNLVRAVPEAVKCGIDYGISVIPGIEIDCQYEGIDLHVLGYNIDPSGVDFSALEEAIHARVMEAFPVMVKRLSGTGIAVDPDEVMQHAGDNLPSGELIAEVLLGNAKYDGISMLDPYRPGGHRSDMPYINFYHDFFAQGKPAYVKIDFMSYSEAIAFIRRNQGVPVVAHPGLNLKGREEIVLELLDQGADGLEAFNNYHSTGQITYFARVAEERKALMTCGSDFHGKTKPLIRPGQYRTIREYEGYVEESIRKILKS